MDLMGLRFPKSSSESRTSSRKEVSLSKEFHRAIKTLRKDCVTASPDVTVKLADKISKSFLVVSLVLEADS